MQNSKSNTIRLRTIMARLPNFTEENKEALCREYSGGRTVNLSKLTSQEGSQMIKDLQKQVPKTSGDKMKKSIIAMAMEIQWRTAQGKIDMQRLNAWCNKYAPLKKDMDDHTEKELPMLVTAFKRNYEYVLKKM